MSSVHTTNSIAFMHNTRIGIDLGGTKIEAVAINAAGDIICQNRISTPNTSYQAVLRALKSLIQKLSQDANLPASTPVGMGTPGAVSLKTGLMKNSNSTCLNGHDLRSDLEAALKRPVRIANDADCFTLSEAIDGAGKTAPSVFGIILGTGVGGGIAVNQRLLGGINAISGEWGHNPLPLDSLSRDCAFPFRKNRSCYCGKRNCIESWLSGPALANSYFEVTGDRLSAREIAAKLSVDRQAQLTFDWYCEMTALALSQVINIVDPHIIVVGGGLSNIEGLYDGVQRYWQQYVFSDQTDTRLCKAVHGDAGGVRGAAWLW
jgi:predicted NBD/HSP70 family sugar kinase